MGETAGFPHVPPSQELTRFPRGASGRVKRPAARTGGTAGSPREPSSQELTRFPRCASGRVKRPAAEKSTASDLARAAGGVVLGPGRAGGGRPPWALLFRRSPRAHRGSGDPRAAGSARPARRRTGAGSLSRRPSLRAAGRLRGRRPSGGAPRPGRRPLRDIAPPGARRQVQPPSKGVPQANGGRSLVRGIPKRAEQGFLGNEQQPPPQAIPRTRDGWRGQIACAVSVAARSRPRYEGVTRYASKTASSWRSALSSARSAFTSPISAVYQFFAS